MFHREPVPPVSPRHRRIPSEDASYPVRPLSSSSSSKAGDKSTKEEDPFGLRFGTDDDHTASQSYVRDATTGKWTGKVRPEASEDELALLRHDDGARSDALLERWTSRFDDAGAVDGEEGKTEEERRVAASVRGKELALGPIGRRPVPPSSTDDDEDGTSLTDQEFAALREMAKQEYDIDLTNGDDEAAAELKGSASSGPGGSESPSTFHDADLDLTYLRHRVSGGAEGGVEEDPFADLLPSKTTCVTFFNGGLMTVWGRFKRTACRMGSGAGYRLRGRDCFPLERRARAGEREQSRGSGEYSSLGGRRASSLHGGWG